MEFRYTDGDEIYTILLEPQTNGTYLARIGEDAYSVTTLPTGELRIDNRTIRVRTAQQDNERFVNIIGSGNTLALERITRQSQRRGSGGAQGDLVAQMPGQVIEVLVAVGQDVGAGDTLLIMEAMKMEMRVTAPFDGTVTKLQVEQGQTIDRGHILAEVTPIE